MPKKAVHPKPRLPSPVYVPDRRIPEWNRILLFTRAGGRCEFDGCQRYLFEHHVTFDEGNFAEFAHMVAFSVNGPRGFEQRPQDVHDLDNLMLLCPTCHKLIDDNPDKYGLATLMGYKKSHEDQILHLTGLRPELKSSALVVKSKVGDQTVEIPCDHSLEAMSPRYPLSKQGFVIDLTALNAQGEGFTRAACEAIEAELKVFLSAAGEARKAKHISLFALAPIPVLMFLGQQLSNKVPLDVFQRHRDTERWRWKENLPPVEYTLQSLRTGSDPANAALLLGLSGEIPLDRLPPEIDGGYSVSSITPANAAADPTLVKTRADLENFRLTYLQAIATLVRNHPALRTIAIFPAVPAPVAVLCGRELLPRAHPALRVYDYDKAKGFYHQLNLNT